MVKVRHVKSPDIVGYASKFNIHGIGETIVYYTDVDEPYLDDCYIKDLEVFIKNKWVNMYDAFENHDLITDNYSEMLFEPTNELDQKRGYTLD